jgi:hypothetical protein
MDLLIHSVDVLTLDRHMGVVGATIWVHDYTLTISDEVTLVWSHRLSLAKVLYFVVSLISRLAMFHKPARHLDQLEHWTSSRPRLGWLLGSYQHIHPYRIVTQQCPTLPSRYIVRRISNPVKATACTDPVPRWADLLGTFRGTIEQTAAVCNFQRSKCTTTDI